MEKCDFTLNDRCMGIRQGNILRTIGSSSPFSPTNAQSYKRRNSGLKAVSLSFTTSSKKAEMICGSPWHQSISAHITKKNRLTSLKPVVDFMFTLKPSRNTEKIDRRCSCMSERWATRMLRLKKSKKAMSPSMCSCYSTSILRSYDHLTSTCLFLRLVQTGPQITKYR